MFKQRCKRFLRRACVGVVAIWVCCAVAICLYGMSIPYQPADVAVIFGNAINPDGSPISILANRLDEGVRCYQNGYCSTLFVSGSIDGPGRDESAAMRDFLVKHGLPEDRIVVDDQGDNTLATAHNAIAYMQAHKLGRVMLISQYYHLARACLAFESVSRGGLEISAAYPHTFQIRDLYSSWREVPALVLYAIRLARDPDASPVTVRPLRYLFKGGD